MGDKLRPQSLQLFVDVKLKQSLIVYDYLNRKDQFAGEFSLQYHTCQKKLGSVWINKQDEPTITFARKVIAGEGSVPDEA